MGSMTKRIKRNAGPYLPPAEPRAAALQRRGTMAVYGVGCSWWDTIDQVARNQAGLPCCPHCGGMLFEMPLHQWSKRVFEQDAKEPGYADFIGWMRGKCFPDYNVAKEVRAMERRRLAVVDRDFLARAWMQGFEAACDEMKGGVFVDDLQEQDVSALLAEVRSHAAAIAPPPTTETGLDELAPAFGVEFALGHLQAFAKRLDQEARERLLASAKRAIMGGE